MKIRKVHLSTIKWGDTVVCKDGHTRTVGKKDIIHGGFFGSTLWGDSYKMNKEKIEKVSY